MAQLLYSSTKDIKVTRDDMRYLQTPPPMGRRHQPYPFVDFCNQTVGALKAEGFNILQEDYVVTKDEGRLFGLVSITKKPAIDPGRETGTALTVTDPTWSLLVGLRGAHDQSFSRALTIGSQIIVCSNLCFHGNLGVWNTKQTTNITKRMPSLIADAVRGVGESAQSMTVDFDMFKNTELTRDEGDKILIDAYRAGGFAPSQFGKAVDDWTECSVPEHTADGRNLWWLFNSATQALKPGGANVNHNDLRDRSMIVYGKLRPVAKQRHLESPTSSDTWSNNSWKMVYN